MAKEQWVIVSMNSHEVTSVYGPFGSEEVAEAVTGMLQEEGSNALCVVLLTSQITLDLKDV